MFIRRSSFFPHTAAVSALLALLAPLPPVTSFTATRGTVFPTPASPIVASTPPSRPIGPCSTLSRRPLDNSRETSTSIGMNFSPPGGNDPGGLREGRYLLIIALLLNVWLFSIPTEFRRARLCTEEDARLRPERNCMTFAMWREGVANYYANGGGVNFDFSIEGKE